MVGMIILRFIYLFQELTSRCLTDLKKRCHTFFCSAGNIILLCFQTLKLDVNEERNSRGDYMVHLATKKGNFSNKK